MHKTSADLRMQPYTFIPQIKSAVFECISVEADSPSFLPYKKIWIQSLSQSFHHSFKQSFSQPFSHSVIPPFIQSFMHSFIYSVSQSVSQSVSHLVSHSVSLFKFEQHLNAFH